MRSIRNSSRLFSEFVAFAREKRVYWILPLIIVLGMAGVVVVAGKAAAPLIYTLF